PCRIAAAHRAPPRATGEEGGEVGIPERVEEWNPQMASTLVELLEVVGDHRTVEGAPSRCSPVRPISLERLVPQPGIRRDPCGRRLREPPSLSPGQNLWSSSLENASCAF